MFQETVLKQLRDRLKSWEKEKSAEFKRERKPSFISESGIEMKRIYTPLDLEEKGIDYLDDIGFPGDYPFVRGVTATGYRGQLWGIQQYSGYSTPEESNNLWKVQIAAGSHNLAVAYDLPTQFGYDPDSPYAEGEVGRVGISMCSLKDWETAFQDIDLSEVFVGQVLNAPAVVGLASLVCLANAKGVKTADIRGAVQNDILKEYQARGCYVFPPGQSLRLASDIAVFCGQNMPLYRGIDVCTYHHAESGATPVHEAAIGMANLIAYLEHIVAKSVDIDSVAPTVRFVISTDNRSFFEHIAKVRAMRKIYAKIVRDRFGAKNPESMKFSCYSGKRGSTLYRQQYLNNIGRSTIAGMAAVFSGCQSLGLRSYDEAYGIPSQEAILTSTRIQQIIAYETGIVDTVDPLAGSYLVEYLTREIEEKILEEMARIDERGGALACTESGYINNMMMKDAYEWQKGVENEEIVIVGVNRFQSDREDEKPATVRRADPRIEADMIASVVELRRRRDNNAVRKALDDVKAAALETGTTATSMVPPVIAAVGKYCTTGEICDTLRQVWGVYEQSQLSARSVQ